MPEWLSYRRKVVLQSLFITGRARCPSDTSPYNQRRLCVNHVFLGQRHSDSASSFYTCRYHSVREEPFRYLRSRVAEDQLSHHRLWRPSPCLTSYVNLPPFPFTLELRSFTAQVELLPMTSGAWNMLFVLDSGPTNLNLGVCGP